MDPLSIFGAVTGGISVTSEIFKALDKAISTASKVKEAPELAISTLRDVGMMRQNMLRFQQLLNSQALAHERGLYIPLGDAQDTFTDCVTSLDELESLLKPLTDPGLQSLAMSERLEWAMKDKRINELSKRVRDAQSSLGLMLTILQHESILEVHKAIAGLAEICQRIAPNVAHLNRRSFGDYAARRHAYDDTDDASTIRPVAVPRPDSVVVPETTPEDESTNLQGRTSIMFNARFAFEEALEASRPYRRAPNSDSEVLSYRSSALNPHALSLLSKLSSLSLGDVSTISVIALPLFCNDISNPEHYNFGELGPNHVNAQITNNVTTNHPIIKPELKQVGPRQPPWLRYNAPSTPQSPSLPLRSGVSRMLNAMRRAFDSDGQKISAPLRPISEYMPLRPTAPLEYSGLVTDKVYPFGSQRVASLGQLSSLRLEDSELHLCHDVGCAPCFGAVDTSIEEAHSTEEVRRWQLNLAASKGYLDAFRCQKCEMSLAKIVQTQRLDWELVELWCGSKSCLSQYSELQPCECYTKILQLHLPADKYLGCRRVFEDEIRCARCFRLCAMCASDEPNDASNIYVLQERLLLIQKKRIENVDNIDNVKHTDDTDNMADLSTNDLRDAIWKLGTNIWSFETKKGVSKDSIAVLKARQAVLVMRGDMLPAWEEMSAFVRNGEYFWNMPLENMRARLNQSQELLDELAKMNRV
ncbi:hypothetical protein B0J13DRAFT_619330 [Dactylonectria estremocensis]|uniref:Fungal N-terminal domain-containing protein n=1 Tax=Dactylonectria estremocensis TaxID=1079267 RepID=A0A9P9F209_9HYPO|nr:hypothetical protein B0J13DRAFT_619330 [Dactylonectria estremocensis]